MRDLITRWMLVLLLCTAGAWAETPVVKIDDLIEMALRYSPDLNVSRAEYKALTQRIREAKADYLPRADLYAGGGASGVELEGTDESGHLLTGQLTASQLLYDFGRTKGNIEASQYDANASFDRLKQRISDKIFQVKKAYYTVLKTRMLIKVNEENIRLNEKQLYRARRYFEAGIRTKIDVSDAKVNLIAARLALQNAQYEFQRARIRLASAIGTEPYGGHYRLDTPDINISYLGKDLPDVDQPFKWLEAFAYAHRPSLRSSEHRIKSARARVESVKADYYPQFYLSGDYTRNDTASEMEAAIPTQSWNAMLNMRWNLFEGFKTDARTEEYRARVLQETASYADAKIRIRREVADSQELLLKIRDGVELSRSLVEAAREKFHQAQKRYESGLSDFIELQQARQGFIQAASGLVTAYYDFYIALALRDRAIGR